jgi:RNA polymerase sigma-70 factor (ECF subfamily)
MSVARRKAIDVARKRFTGETVAGQLQILAEGLETAAAEHGEIPDRRLALLFACAHPAIDAGVRAPLMLQVVVGLDAKTIASAFLMSPAAMGKRLGRAKDKPRHGGIPFSVPEREELSSRLDSVLEAIYAAFAEGWSDPGAADVVRDLTSEAMFLVRVVTELLPDEPEALGVAGVPASRRSATSRAAQREWRIRSVGRAGFGARVLLAPSADINWRLRCNRRTFIAAAQVTRTGRMWRSSMMRCLRSPRHRWWR